MLNTFNIWYTGIVKDITVNASVAVLYNYESIYAPVGFIL